MARWTLALIVAVLVVVAGGIGFLMVWEPAPPVRDVERAVVIPSERLGR